MKKTILFSTLLIMLSVFSCKEKTYQCSCASGDTYEVVAKSEIEGTAKCDLKGQGCTWNGEN